MALRIFFEDAHWIVASAAFSDGESVACLLMVLSLPPASQPDASCFQYWSEELSVHPLQSTPKSALFSPYLFFLEMKRSTVLCISEFW